MHKIKHNKKYFVAIPVAFLTLTILCSTKLYADQPVISCNALSFTDLERKKSLSDAAFDAASESDLAEAASIYRHVMKICNDDPFVEFNIARVYQKMGICTIANYHFERLENMRTSDPDLEAALQAEFAKIKTQCHSAIPIQITCESEGTLIDIPAISLNGLECPFYGKLNPGEYPINITTAEGTQKREFLSVKNNDRIAQLSVSSLPPPDTIGTLKVICPKGQTKFTLLGEKTNMTYPCPWIGQITQGEYKIFIEGAERTLTEETITIKPQQQTDHYIISKNDKKQRCATSLFTNQTHHSLTLILITITIIAIRRRKFRNI